MISDYYCSIFPKTCDFCISCARPKYRGIMFLMAQSVFFSNFLEQKKTVETLTKESRADIDFYIFLAGSGIITTLGLLINSAVVVIGGMLVAPLLFPIMSLGMGIVTSSKEAISRSISTIGKSVLLVFVISFSIAFLMNAQTSTPVIELASTASLEHFIIAFISGIVAAFAWVRQNTNASLPGIAVSVSLIPPLSSFAIGVSLLDKGIASGSLMLFIINLIGIAIAGLLVFSLFGFSNMQKVQEHVIREEKKENGKAKRNKVKKEEKIEEDSNSEEATVVEKIPENTPLP